MVHLSDREFVIAEYRDSSNLDARIQLHERFSTNRYDWHRWVFDHLDLADRARILELGCGPADLWRRNRERIPPGWEITLSDQSAGMLVQAEVNLGQPGGRVFHFREVDAQSIPCADGSFDAVIANHMLYHVPDLPRALSEIRRVLRTGGRLFAATNGLDHMRELLDLIRQVVDPPDQAGPVALEFGLENGAAKLAPYFPEVRRIDYADGLVVTDSEPLIAYVLSSLAWGDFQSGRDNLDRLTSLIDRQMAGEGAIRITKSSGLFIARRD